MCARHGLWNLRNSKYVKGSEIEILHELENPNSLENTQKRLQDLKPTKEHNQMNKFKKIVIKAPMHVTVSMASTTLKKITILEEQTTMTLLTIHEYQLVLEEAWDYFKVMKVWKFPKTLIALEDKDTSFGHNSNHPKHSLPQFWTLYIDHTNRRNNRYCIKMDIQT